VLRYVTMIKEIVVISLLFTKINLFSIINLKMKNKTLDKYAKKKNIKEYLKNLIPSCFVISNNFFVLININKNNKVIIIEKRNSEENLIGSKN
jgi:hypothetical protein